MSQYYTPFLPSLSLFACTIYCGDSMSLRTRLYSPIFYIARPSMSKLIDTGDVVVVCVFVL